MKHKKDPAIKTPLWKWLVFILVALGMPLLYTYISDAQIEQVEVETGNATPATSE